MALSFPHRLFTLPPATPRQERRGFTLIELLVVIAVIAVLAAILFPVFSLARSKARQATCLANLKQIGSAMMLYRDDWNGYFVSSTTYSGTVAPGAPWGFATWVYQLNQGYVKTMKCFQCPAAHNPWTIPHISPPLKCGFGMNEVLYYRHLYGMSHESKIVHPADTLLVADAYEHTFVHDWNDWGDPYAPANYDNLPSGMVRCKYADGLGRSGRELTVRHGGSNVLFADGHARLVRPEEFRAVNYPQNRPAGFAIPPNRNDTGCREYPVIWPPAEPYR